MASQLSTGSRSLWTTYGPRSLENKAFLAWELSVGVATVIGVEILGERPAWSMTDSEKLSTLDAVVAERARLKTVELQLIADLDQSGYTKDIGAGDTARLLSLRYRIDA